MHNGDGYRVSQTINEGGATVDETTYVLDSGTPLAMVLSETTKTIGKATQEVIATEPTLYYLHGLGLVVQSDGTRCPPACVDKAGIKIPSARIPAEARGEYLLR